MTDNQRKFFIALNKDRAESADMLEKPSMSGIQRSVVEKYTDQAHFIYELLQMIEDTMFGSPTYIEDNSFATSHQTVNVYGQPEMKYEIRSEDAAVDVQVHRIYVHEKSTSMVEYMPSMNKYLGQMVAAKKAGLESE